METEARASCPPKPCPVWPISLEQTAKTSKKEKDLWGRVQRLSWPFPVQKPRSRAHLEAAETVAGRKRRRALGPLPKKQTPPLMLARDSNSS